GFGHLFADFEKVEEDRCIHGIAAVVVGKIHAAAQRGAGGVGHHGREDRRVGGEDDGFFGGELAVLLGDAEALEEVWREAAELIGVGDFDLADVVLHG